MFPYKTLLLIVPLFALLLLAGASEPDSFHFVILGDRTGESQPGVYEHLWEDLAAQAPAFVVSTGDTIEGTSDATAESQWRHMEDILSPWKRFSLYLAPGNHDIWSVRSEQLYREYSGRALHYSFDYQQAHFTILDNSRSDQLSAAELSFLDDDLREHKDQPLKFIISHRPSWILNALLDNPKFELHQIVKKYGVQFVIAGHLHQLLHVDLDGVTYVSMPSAGGHLRGAAKYQDGWFFGYASIDVKGKTAEMRMEESDAPYGQARSTKLSDWGKAGLVQ